MHKQGLSQQWFVVLGFLGLQGCCPPKEYHDKDVCRTKRDFQRLNKATPAMKQWRQRPGLPDLRPYPPAFYAPVSLTLSGQIPLKQALFELARQAQVNIIIDASFPQKRRFFFAAHQQPFVDVVDNLCSLGGLRYSVDKGTLRIGSDRPHLKNHNVQFLLGFRKTETQTSVTTDILSDGLQPGARSLSDNGASISLRTGHVVDFWSELERNIAMILSQGPGKPQYSINRYAGILSVHGTFAQHKQVETYLAHLRKATMTQILVEAKIIEIDLSQDYRNGINWSAFVDRMTQPVDPATTPNLAKAAIEGQIMERAALLKGSIGGDGNSVLVQTDNLEAVVNLLDEFGTVRTLANPRQTVMNNQAAVLKVAHNEVFFELQIQDETLGTNGSAYGGFRQRAQSRIQTVPIGLILYVHPSLNWETGDIMVSLHPTISRVQKTMTDPAPLLYRSYTPYPGQRDPNNRKQWNRALDPVLAGSQVPVVQIREMDSVIVAKEGQVIVTGGLMEERVNLQDKGVPGLSSVPGVGKIFTNSKQTRHLTELVILLKLTVIKDGNSITPADQRLYQCFTADPRPMDVKAQPSSP